MWSYELRLWQAVKSIGRREFRKWCRCFEQNSNPLWAPVAEYTHAQYVIWNGRMFLAGFSRVVTGWSYIYHPDVVCCVIQTMVKTGLIIVLYHSAII